MHTRTHTHKLSNLTTTNPVDCAFNNYKSVNILCKEFKFLFIHQNNAHIFISNWGFQSELKFHIFEQNSSTEVGLTAAFVLSFCDPVLPVDYICIVYLYSTVAICAGKTRIIEKLNLRQNGHYVQCFMRYLLVWVFNEHKAFFLQNEGYSHDNVDVFSFYF